MDVNDVKLSDIYHEVISLLYKAKEFQEAVDFLREQILKIIEEADNE
jgi:hypothetical protein